MSVDLIHKDTGDTISEITGASLAIPSVGDAVAVQKYKIKDQNVIQSDSESESETETLRVTDRDVRYLDVEIDDPDEDDRVLTRVILWVLPEEEYRSRI